MVSSALPATTQTIPWSCGRVAGTALVVAILVWYGGQWLGLPWGVVAVLEWGAGTLIGWWANHQSERFDVLSPLKQGDSRRRSTSATE
jgi:hypothetical protein